jgi:N6-L-threonylcarbamoyladenine synthase
MAVHEDIVDRRRYSLSVDKSVLILGIESSCDETAAAIVRGGEELVSSVVASQIATHSPYGGVVPELASREHLRNLVPVTRAALAKAGLTYADVDAIAVTNGPGLAGALLTGVSFAKSLAWALQKPLIAVNHIEGHIHAVLLEQRQKGAGALAFPVLALVVSGGHTHLFLAEQRGDGWHYENIGHTRDDAAGEAFDKTAKLLGLGYPGGPIIDRISKFGDPKAVKFTMANLKHVARNESKRAGRMEQDHKRFDFSYSGIKTGVLRYVEAHDMFGAIEARRHALLQIAGPTDEEFKNLCDQRTLDLVASFQAAVVSDLTHRTMAACEEYGVKTLLVTGGVAANSALRASFDQRGRRSGVRVHFPSRIMSTDNAAMIAAAAYSKWVSKEFAGLDVSAEPDLQLR